MPEKKPKPKSLIEKIQANVKLAFSFQDEDNWKQDSERYLDYFKGRYYAASTASDKYVVNTVFNFINLIVPNLFFREPFIRVKPKSRNIMRKQKDGSILVIPTWRNAQLMESVINKLLKDIRFANEIRKCVQDVMFYGFAVMKVGYGMETESVPDTESPEENNETTRIKEEGVFAMRVSPLDFGYDPASTSTDDARFVIHRVVKPLDEVKESDVYENTDEIKAQMPEDFKKRLGGKKGEVEGDFCTLYEFHDLLKNKIYTLTDDSKKFQRKMDNPHDFTGSHFVALKLAGNNDEFRGIPFIGMIEDEAIALNETITKMIRHLDLFPGQVLAEEGAIDEDEMQLMQDGEQGSILPVQNGAIREGRITVRPPLPMGSDYFNVSRTLQGLMDLVLGVPDFQRQGMSRRKTATESTFENADSTIRREYFLGFVKDFILNVVGKIAAMVQQYYDREREIRIEGDTGIDFVKFTKEDISGEFDFDFDLESMRFASQSKAQQMINALNILGAHPVYQPLLKELDPQKLAKELFKQMDLNYESFKKRPETTHLEFDPQAENMIAMKNRRIPDPKPMEDHADHLAIHAIAYEQTHNEELLRHMQMHQFLKQVVSGEINAQQLQQMIGQQAAAQTPMQPPTNGAGGFQPTAGPALTEPEIAGGFFSNLPQ